MEEFNIDNERGGTVPLKDTEKIMSKVSSQEEQHILETEMRL